jgi:hypothetical protein
MTYRDASGALLNPLKTLRLNGTISKEENCITCDIYHNGYADFNCGVWQVAIKDVYYKFNESKLAKAHKLFFELSTNFVQGYSTKNECEMVCMQVFELDYAKKEGLVKFDILWFNVTLLGATVKLFFKTFADKVAKVSAKKQKTEEFDYEIGLVVSLLFKRVL